MNVNPSRRLWLARALAAAGALAVSHAFAQSVRSGPIRIVVGFQAGALSDRIARILAAELARVSGRPVIVENVVGANSLRAMQRVVSSDAGGDTLMLATSAIAHPDNAALSRELRPVIAASTSPMILAVRAGLGVRGPREFADWLAHHADAAYGSAGVGNATHLCTAEMLDALGRPALHVPYPGSPATHADLIAGRIDFAMSGVSATLMQSDAVRVVAVTSRTRSGLPGLEGLPTIAETLVPGFDCVLWQAIWAPAATSDAAVAALNAQMRVVLAQPSVRAALADAGAEVLSGSPSDAQRLRSDEESRFARRKSP